MDEKARSAIKENLDLLLSVGTDLNATTADGRTALHIAAIQHDHHSAHWLLDHGADPTVHNGRGKSPADVLRSRLESTGQYLEPDQRKEADDLLRLLDARSRAVGRAHRR